MKYIGEFISKNSAGAFQDPSVDYSLLWAYGVDKDGNYTAIVATITQLSTALWQVYYDSGITMYERIVFAITTTDENFADQGFYIPSPNTPRALWTNPVRTLTPESRGSTVGLADYETSFAAYCETVIEDIDIEGADYAIALKTGGWKTDEQSIIFISHSVGLEFVNGQAHATPLDGSISYNVDERELTVIWKDTVGKLVPVGVYKYSVKDLVSAGISIEKKRGDWAHLYSYVQRLAS